MNETENARARREAMDSAGQGSSSASRARLWAGLNRYLAAEGERAHTAAVRERQESTEPDPDTSEKPDGSEKSGPGSA